jgi:hypothetical protein
VKGYQQLTLLPWRVTVTQTARPADLSKLITTCDAGVTRPEKSRILLILIA